MKTHFVTGGTGFIGTSLVNALLRKGDSVYLLVRPNKNQQNILQALSEYKGKVTIIEGDVSKINLGINNRKLQNLKNVKIDYFWHLAANLSFKKNLQDTKRFKTNVKGTQNALRLANAFNTVFCHCSTAYVCGNSKNFSEDSYDIGQSFRNGYEHTKFLAEKDVRENAKVPFIIFRPSLVIDKPTPGKASNCTFGYYRYVFMFYLFKKWLIKNLTTGGLKKKLLNLLAIKLDKRGIITAPYLILPYPKKITVNMVTIDYVVSTFIKIASSKSAYNKTYHLTNPNPQTFIFMMKVLLDNLQIKRVKYLAISPFLFATLLKVCYFVFVPWRNYLKSALFYLPYISTSPTFLRKNVNLFNSPPKPLSKDYLNKINNEAITEVFPKIKN